MVVPGSQRRTSPVEDESGREQYPSQLNEARYSRDSGRSTTNMTLEMLNVQGVWVPHHVVPIVGDGACLFRALSFLIFNTQDQARTVRQQIVHLVTSEWQTFSILSHDSRGDNYRSAAAYSAEMSRPYTYGSLCELMAAGIIYNLRFEVYRNGILYTSTGSFDLPVRRLRFRDNLSAGHFDAYVPMGRGGRRASAI